MGDAKKKGDDVCARVALEPWGRKKRQGGGGGEMNFKNSIGGMGEKKNKTIGETIQPKQGEKKTFSEKGKCTLINCRNGVLEKG